MSDDTVELKILDGLSGVLRPGRMTLLLGPPACGKSTLLRVLAGRQPQMDNYQLSGDLKCASVRYSIAIGAAMHAFDACWLCGSGVASAPLRMSSASLYGLLCARKDAECLISIFGQRGSADTTAIRQRSSVWHVPQRLCRRRTATWGT